MNNLNTENILQVDVNIKKMQYNLLLLFVLVRCVANIKYCRENVDLYKGMQFSILLSDEIQVYEWKVWQLGNCPNLCSRLEMTRPRDLMFNSYRCFSVFIS